VYKILVVYICQSSSLNAECINLGCTYHVNGLTHFKFSIIVILFFVDKRKDVTLNRK